MRVPLLFSAAVLLVAGRASAQSSPVTCSGTPAADWTVSIKDAAGNFTPLAPSALSTLLGSADCLCDPSDLYADAYLVTSPVAMDAAFPYEVWVGSSCNTSTRATQCEQLNPTTTLSNYKPSGEVPRERIPVRAIISPAPVGGNNMDAHQCVDSSSNSMWFLFNPDQTNGSYCSITLPSKNTPPAAAENVQAGSADEAILLSWETPPEGATLERPVNYQVLCADANGNPLPDTGAYGEGDQHHGNQLGYSTCLASGQVQRRVLQELGGSTSLVDGGVVDMATPMPTTTTTTTSDPLPAPDAVDAGVPEDQPLAPQANPVDGGTPGGAAGTYGPAPFTNLDKKYVCSQILPGDTTTFRVPNLQNGQTYKFLVVGIDEFGNAAPSSVVTGVPQPVEDLYRRFRTDGGSAQGFCFIATAAYGSYEHPFVRILRDFRDQALLPHAAGRAFVDWYYATSPPYAHFIAQHSLLRAVVRVFLWPLIGFAEVWLHPLLLLLVVPLLLLTFLAGRRAFHRLREARRPVDGSAA